MHRQSRRLFHERYRPSATDRLSFHPVRHALPVPASLIRGRRLRAISQEGAKPHRWQGGKTQADHLIRHSLDYTLWREAIYQRDDFTCQLCGARGGRLAAHHIIRFAIREDLHFTVSSGITLCWPYHRSIKSKEHEYEARFFAITGGAWRTGGAKREAQVELVEDGLSTSVTTEEEFVRAVIMAEQRMGLPVNPKLINWLEVNRKTSGTPESRQIN